MLLYTGVDLLSAIYLFDIASTQAATVSRSYSSPRKSLSWNPLSVAAVYLFDPLTILTCLARSTSVFTTMLTLLSVIKACQAKATASIFALAMASSLGLHPILLAPPIGVLCYDRIQQRHASRSKSDSRNTAPPGAIAFTFRLAVTFGAITALLLLISRTLVPSWSFLESVYATPLTLPDLTPNTGLWWYFFIEMFDPFRSFFLGVFWLHMLSYSVPLCLRFQKQPLAAVVIMVGVIAVFEPYASAGDAGVFLSVLCLLSHTFERKSDCVVEAGSRMMMLTLVEVNKYTYPAVATLIYVFFLGPAFHHLWIYAGSGNANFFYAITLVWNLGLLVLLTDAIYSVLRDEWEVMRPEMKGKSVARI